MSIALQRLTLFPRLSQLFGPLITKAPLPLGLEPASQQPVVIGDYSILQMNRNARTPKKANHGARPCSSVMRRLKKKNLYRKMKEEVMQEADEFNIRHLHEVDKEELSKD